jgi:probable phosphoglycerate mutase
MLLFYVRHGDPVYAPDSLTPLGQRQAEAVAKRLALFGVDRIFASTSIRATQTAQPTAELCKKEITLLDFAHEHHVWKELGVIPYGDGTRRTWPWNDAKLRQQFLSAEVRALGHLWYTHPCYASYETLGPGMERVRRESYAFLAALGYEWDAEAGGYRVTRENEDRVALFAHQGFGLAFLSVLLDIPYPLFAGQFDLSHSDMTVVEFAEVEGYAHPRVLTLSNDAHLYREGLPTKYNNRLYF